MKPLILYATKHGAAKLTAHKIAEQLSSEVMDVKDSKDDLNARDIIILGSCVYAGLLNKGMKEFCKTHAAVLKQKKTIFYICGILKDKETIYKELCENLGKEFADSLHFYIGVGGILDMKKMNLMERQIIKMVNSKAGMIENLDKHGRYDLLCEENLQTLVEEACS